MAITLTKGPAKFFNCTSPVIFEFTTDSEVGNFDDYVCDVIITSLWATKTAVIRNVFPNTQTKLFSVDASEFFKALQLNGFEFDFDGSKNLSVEKFTTNIKIRDGSVPNDDSFRFNNYTFDNFIFTDGLGAIDSLTGVYFSILGERLLFDKFANPITETQLTFLTPDVIEVCAGFDNYISVFNNELIGNSVTVAGITSAIAAVDGVATYKLTASQVQAVKSLTAVTCTNQNPAKTLQAFNYRDEVNDTVQFRFINPKGGFSYFYAPIDSQSSDRSKVTFYDRNYFNEGDNKSPAVQAGSDYKNELNFKGSKIKELHELFDMMLRSPKIEMNLKQINGNDVFIECEVTGVAAKQYRTFDFQLKAKITNSGNFKL